MIPTTTLKKLKVSYADDRVEGVSVSELANEMLELRVVAREVAACVHCELWEANEIAIEGADMKMTRANALIQAAIKLGKLLPSEPSEE